MCDIKQGYDGQYLGVITPEDESGDTTLTRRIAEPHFLDLYTSADNKRDNGTDTDEVNFQSRDDGGAILLPFWRTTSRYIIYEASPLLLHHHYYDNRGLIETGRGVKTLGDFLERMPDSSYELSFQDLIQDEQNAEDFIQEVALKNKKHCKKTAKAYRIVEKFMQSSLARSSSTGSKQLLLTISLPVNTGPKKKSKRKGSTVSSEAFGEGSERTESKKWWKISCLDTSQKAATTDVGRTRTYCRCGLSCSSKKWYVCGTIE